MTFIFAVCKFYKKRVTLSIRQTNSGKRNYKWPDRLKSSEDRERRREPKKQRIIATLKREGILCSSAGKESACNAGDPVLLPGSESSPEKGIGQYSWPSLVAQRVKNLPAMRET